MDMRVWEKVRKKKSEGRVVYASKFKHLLAVRILHINCPQYFSVYLEISDLGSPVDLVVKGV